jgi:hypothetical protein
MKKPPEQGIANYLFVSGYAPGTIIAYLEGMANAGKFEFSEGDYVDFAVCERPDGTRYGTVGECNPETGKTVSPTSEPSKSGEKPKVGEKPKASEKPDKTAEEIKMDKMKETAKKQGSDPANNRKVVIDGNEYGWAQKAGKWIMVPWGSVAGIKKVGPKQSARPRRSGGRRRRGESTDPAVQGRIQGLRTALERQATDAGRDAIMEQILELGGTL